MARTTTTLSGAVVVDQNTISVASATGFASGSLVRVDDEIMEVQDGYISGLSIPVLRGREGTATQTHVSGANVTVQLASDFAAQPPQTKSQTPIAAKAKTLISYGAAGAIAVPAPGNDAVAVINGTSALAMTIAHPTKDMDACELIVIGNGKAAHTLTFPTGGIGNSGAGYTVLTFAAGAQVGVRFIAANGFWVAPGAPAFAGTATNLLATLS